MNLQLKTGIDRYVEKVKACFLGKSIGGTLGMPYEGFDGPFSLSFYDPVPTAMVPNDDLDIQVVFASVLNELETPCVNRNILARAWLDHIDFPFSEYAIAIRNLKLGLVPPFSGAHDNWYINGMGAAIRTELWACLAPANPKLAMAYSYEDACVDHAEEGVWSAAFLAALQSEAFVTRDIDTLLDKAIVEIPVKSLIRQAVSDTRFWWESNNNWLEVRSLILEKYGHEDFTDVKMNISFMILGLLAGQGDFGRSICIAVNCGKDADCTAATLGALLGIMDPDCIDSKWLGPIGSQLKVSPGINKNNLPPTIEDFIEIVIELHDKISDLSFECDDTAMPFQPELTEIPVDIGFVSYKAVYCDLFDLTQGIQMPANSGKTLLPGSFVKFPKEQFEDETLLVRYSINLDRDRKVRVMFNTPLNCRVWIDQNYCFGREGGRMAPSPHIAPINQYIDIELQKGTHGIIAAVACPESDFAEWGFAVADAKTKQLIPSAIWNCSYVR